MNKIFDWLKAKIWLLIISIVWLSLILVCFPLMLIALIYDKKRADIDWLYSVFLAQDYLVSAISGNHHNTTISALLGHMKLSGSKTGTAMAKVVDLLFKLARNEDDHCVSVMKKTDVYQFSARRAIAGFTLYLIGMCLVYFAVVFLIFLQINWG